MPTFTAKTDFFDNGRFIKGGVPVPLSDADIKAAKEKGVKLVKTINRDGKEIGKYKWIDARLNHTDFPDPEDKDMSQGKK